MRKKGRGRQLVRELAQALKTQGCTRITVETSSNNDLLAFYKKLGFKETARNSTITFTLDTISNTLDCNGISDNATITLALDLI